MRHSTWLFSLLGLVLFAAGCTGVYGHGTSVYDSRYPDTRRVDARTSRYHHRIDRDVRDYVNVLDRRLRLDRRQHQQIQRLLADRTYRLLDRTRAYNHDQVYPFPRSTGYRHNQAVERWWNNVDRSIERQLDRRQRDVYRSMTRRYDDRYDRHDRHDRPGKKKGRSTNRPGQRRGHD